MSINPSELMPRRNAGIIRRVWARLVGDDPAMGPQPEQQETTKSGASSTAGNRDLFEDYFSTSSDRLAVYTDAQEMDDNSEEASVALDVLVDNACTSEDGAMTSFEIHSADDPTQAQLLGVTQRADLHHKAPKLLRNALKFGDFFAEVVVNGEYDVVDLRQLAPRTMHRNEDSFGNLMLGEPRYDQDGKCLNRKGECAFEQRDPQTGEVFAAFFPWQIVHGRWNHDELSKYGRSLLRVPRITWKKLHAVEEALIMGRLVRAMLKLVFYVDTTGQSRTEKVKTLQAFEAGIKQSSQVDAKRQRPFSVLTDFFLSTEHIRYGGQVVPSNTKIESIDPKNDGLQEIDDVKYLQRKLLADLRVPPAYYGFEEDINSKNTVSMQDVQFIRLVRRAQQFMGQCLRQVYDTQLALKSMVIGDDDTDEETDYTIKWPQLSVADEQAAADAFYRMAQAYSLMLGTNAQNQTPVITREYIQKHGLEMSDEEMADINAELDRIAAEELAAAEAAAKMQANTQLPSSAFAGGPPANGIKPGASNGSSVHNHSQRADPAKTANGANTSRRSTKAIRQEVLQLRSSIRQAGDAIDGPFRLLEQEQRDALSLARDLTRDIPTAQVSEMAIVAAGPAPEALHQETVEAIRGIQEAASRPIDFHVNVPEQPQPKPRRLVRETQFVTDDSGKIVGKTETETEVDE